MPRNIRIASHSKDIETSLYEHPTAPESAEPALPTMRRSIDRLHLVLLQLSDFFIFDLVGNDRQVLDNFRDALNDQQGKSDDYHGSNRGARQAAWIRRHLPSRPAPIRQPTPRAHDSRPGHIDSQDTEGDQE